MTQDQNQKTEYIFQDRSSLTLLILILGILSLISVGILVLSFIRQLYPFGFAEINKQLNYQGKLQDADGITVPDGTYSMKFSIYDAPSGGSRLWTECGTTSSPVARRVQVLNGVFSVLLGDTGATDACADDSEPNAINLDFNSASYYLGVTVGSDSEMTPRKRIGAAGYAFNADLLDGLDESAFGRLAQDETVTGSWTFTADNTTFHNILPAADNTYDLGSATLRWRNLYLGPGSLRIYNQNDATNYEAIILGYETNVATLRSTKSGTGTTRPLQILTGTGIDPAIYIDTANNVGVGTTGPNAKLDILSTSTQLRLTYSDTVYSDLSVDSGGNLTINSSGNNVSIAAGDNFFVDTNVLYVDAGGDSIGIGTNMPNSNYAVDLQTDKSTGLSVVTSNNTGKAVYGKATAVGDHNNYGGYFIAAGNFGRGIYAEVTAANDYAYAVQGYASGTGSVANKGGWFLAAGDSGVGVYGEASATGVVTNYGGYFTAAGDSGRGVYGKASGTGGAYGVYGEATGASGTNYGVYGTVTSSTGWAGYFTGGYGLYGSKVVGGLATDPGTYELYVTGEGYLSSDLRVAGHMGLADASVSTDIALDVNETFSGTIIGASERIGIKSTATSDISDDYLLEVYGTKSSASYTGTSTAQKDVYGVYGEGKNSGTGTLYSSMGVYGISQRVAGAITNGYGGNFVSSNATTNYGIYALAYGGTTSYGVYASASGGTTNWAGYFTGGYGLYGDKLVGGLATDPGTYELYITGEGYLSSDLTVTGDLAVNGGDITTTATTFNLLAGATSTLNIGPSGNTAVSINLAGGSSDTGCTVAGITGDLTCAGTISGLGIHTGSGSSGQVTFWTGTYSQSGDSNFYWDNTNKFLGVGTSPSYTLHVSSSGTRAISASTSNTNGYGVYGAGTDTSASAT
ncbi:MAG: hypothetical protein QXN96_02380, partial [Candidatus Bathyarchaeia archaeon]